MKHKFTVRLKIQLNQKAFKLWNDGNWIYFVDSHPVRWFPAAWNLKERNSRQMFQAAIFDPPASIP